MKNLTIAFLGLVLFAVPGLTQQPSTGATIGSVNLTLPSVEGYIEASQLSQGIVDLMASFSPKTNRHIAGYLTEEDVALLRSGTDATMDRYILMQTFRATEQRALSAKEFGEVKAFLKSNMSFEEGFSETIQNSFNDGAKQGSDTAMKQNELLEKMDLSQPKLIAIGEETPNSFAFTTVMEISTLSEGVTTSFRLFTENLTMMVNGKVVYIYAYAKAIKGSEFEDVQNLARRIKNQLMAAN